MARQNSLYKVSWVSVYVSVSELVKKLAFFRWWADLLLWNGRVRQVVTEFGVSDEGGRRRRWRQQLTVDGVVVVRRAEQTARTWGEPPRDAIHVDRVVVGAEEGAHWQVLRFRLLGDLTFFSLFWHLKHAHHQQRYSIVHKI